MEMRVIAKHTVKPSSPTPDRFKTHKLSKLDQCQLTIYIPLVFFYENNRREPLDEILISRRLRQSLSEILTMFYPLAGTIKENSFVDCDDTGVEFEEVRVHARLAPLIQNSNMEEIKQLVHAEGSSHNDSVILSVKTSYFDCGGIAVGVCLSHKIGDAASFAMFMNSWAATCRGESERIIHPSFDLAVQFPPTPNDMYALSIATKADENTMTKRFVFESKKIDKLRKEAATASGNDVKNPSTGNEVKNPSRVEAVSAFIWRNFIDANKPKSSSWAATHAVNVRPRTVPPLPDHTFGNLVTIAITVISSAEDGGARTGPLVSKLRAAIRVVDNDYIYNFDKDDDIQTEDSVKPELCPFTSWCRFPMYDVDFGWGKPVWVATTSMPIMDLTLLMTTPSGDGIEAWVNLNPNDHFSQLLQANFNNL